MKANVFSQTEDKEKKPILFLHGYLSSGKSFSPVLFLLRKKYRVFAPDMAGFGDNQKMPYPYALSDYVRDVSAYVDEQGIRGCAVVAHSFGARVAVRLASTDKTAFSALILTGAAGVKPRFSIGRFFKKLRYRTVKKRLTEEEKEKYFSSDYRGLSPVMKKSFIKIVNTYTLSDAKSVSIPTLILSGEKDKETPPYTQRAYKKRFPNAELTFLKNAGHFAFLDKPFGFFENVEDFLTRIGY